MNLAEKISNAEYEVMKILWREDGPVPFTAIRLELQAIKGWEKSTINTLVRRLVEKKVIEANKKDIMYYTANISEEEYMVTEEKSMLDKLYGGSAKKFVAALCHRGQLNEDDIKDLKKYFMMEEGGND